MFCSKCGAENPEGKKYCSDCAAELIVNKPAVKDDTAGKSLFCPSCGAENSEGKKYCSDCAAELGAARPAAQAPPPIAATPAQPQGEQKKAGSFWKSGAGIALIVIIGVVVLGGITTGIIFAVKGGGSSGGGDLAKVWEEYESIANETEAAQAKITMDPTSLNKAKADLEAAQKKAKALQDVLAQTKVPEPQQKKYAQLEKTIDVYDEYAGASVDLYETLADAAQNNTLAANQAAIDTRFQEIKGLLTDLKDAMEEFLANNSVVTARPTFDPEVAIVTIDKVKAETKKTTGTTTGGDEKPAPTTPEPGTNYADVAGTYVISGGNSTITITLNSDGTYARNFVAEGGQVNVNQSGTYTVSGNTVTFSGDGQTGTIVNGTLKLN